MTDISTGVGGNRHVYVEEKESEKLCWVFPSSELICFYAFDQFFKSSFYLFISKCLTQVGEPAVRFGKVLNKKAVVTD